MKLMRMIAIVAALMLAVPMVQAASQSADKELFSSQPGSLTPSSTKGPFYYQSESELQARKFCRGLANVALCVGEIPNQMFREAHETSPVTGVVCGAFKGVAKGSKRLVIGVWEMVTFYHPGANHYQPYITPEVVFQEDLH